MFRAGAQAAECLSEASRIKRMEPRRKNQVGWCRCCIPVFQQCWKLLIIPWQSVFALRSATDWPHATHGRWKTSPLPRPSKVRCCVSGMSWLVIRGGPLECRCIASAKGFRGAGCFVAAISGQRNPRQIDKVGPAARRYARGKVWFLEARIWNGGESEVSRSTSYWIW